MVKIPAYTNEEGLNTGAQFMQLQRPDTHMANALQGFGRDISSLAEPLLKLSIKAEAQAKADDNLRLDAAGMKFANEIRDEALRRQEDMPEGGFGYHQGMVDFARTKAEEYRGQFAQREDQAKVDMTFLKAAEPVLDQTAGIEFSTRLNWRKDISEAKINDLTTSVAADPANAEQAAKDWQDFASTNFAGANIQAKALQFGFSKIARAELEGIAARDPVALRTAFQGSFENQPAKNAEPHIAQIVQSARDNGVNPRVMLGVAQIESRLKVDAGEPIGKDGVPMSSAKGMWQILKAPDTLNELGLTAENRTDPNVATPAIGRFFSKWTGKIQEAGVEVTPGKQYMLWNLGPGAALAVMKANPNESIDSVLSRVYANRGPGFVQKILANNPSLYRSGMTAGQVVANYDRKMSVAMKETDSMVSGKNMTTDEQAQGVFKGLGLKGAKYLTARDAGEVFVKTDTLIGTQTREQAQNQLGNAIIAGDVRVNRYESENQKAVSEVVAKTDIGPKVATGDNEALIAARNLTESVGFVPEPIINGYREAINGKGASEAKIKAYASLTELQTNNPTAFDASKIPEDEKARIKEYRAYTEVLNMKPADALARVDFLRSPEGIQTKKAQSEEVKKELKTFGWGDIAHEFDQDYFSDPAAANGQQQSLAVDAARQAYEYHRATGKSPEEARANAIIDMKKTWGITRVNGDQTFTPYPIENSYPSIAGSHDWIADQARKAVATELVSLGKLKDLPETRVGTKGGGVSTVPGRSVADQTKDIEFRLVARVETAQDIRAGQQPRYELWYRKPDGTTEVTRARWFKPDETLAIQEWNDKEEAAIRNRARPLKLQPGQINLGAGIIR